MTPTYKIGELVWVVHNSRGAVAGLETKRLPGIVVEIRPWVIGGSGITSWRDRDSQSPYFKVTHTEKSSEYLVVSPSGEFQSWFDEKNLTLEE